MEDAPINPAPKPFNLDDSPAPRPFEQQSTLEKVLRTHLWHANDVITRGKHEFPQCVRRKEYDAAGQWQLRTRKAEQEAKEIQDLLDLYELERAAWEAKAKPFGPEAPTTKI